ncbi:MAG TPA: hypothetical protein VMT88_13245 [Actinomycetes bacterium]|nr:hypothetical protein [Actinomycetes bacterium]
MTRLIGDSAGTRGDPKGALVWTAVIAGVFALAGAVTLDVLDGQGLSTLQWVPFCFTFMGVGVVILRRATVPTIGWLFLLVGVDVAASLFFGSYAEFGVTRDVPGAAWSAVCFTLTIWLSLTVFLVLQLFPDGLPMSPRWGGVARATVAVTVIGMISSGLSAQEDFTSNFPSLKHPAQVLDESLAHSLFMGAQYATLLLFVLSAISVALRYRRSRGVERQQMKWLAAAGAVASFGFVVTALWSEWVEPVVAFTVLMPLVPIACGAAILRYHLYDIDRIVSRTTSYAVVTALLVGAYGVAVTGAPRLLPVSNALTVAAATLFAAGAFRPVLRHVQSVIDRRFDRERYDADREVDGFAARLRDEVDTEQVVDDLSRAVSQTLAPASMGLWVWERDV